MKLIAIMPVRNEDWILGLSLRAALMWCDAVIVLIHASTDNTENIVTALSDEFRSRLPWKLNADTEWNEMAHRQQLLDGARFFGATHIAIVDADEVLSGNLLPNIRPWIERTPAGEVFQLPWVSLRGSIHQYHQSGLWAMQDVSTAFLDEPHCHWAARNGYDFHQRAPMGRAEIPYRPIRGVHKGGLMHLQFVSERRLKWKQLLYKLTELQRWPGREPIRVVDERYNLAVYGDAHKGGTHFTGGLAPTPAAWWEPYAHLMQYLDVDAAPWQEQACRDILAARPELAQGLDTFGLI